MRLLWGALLTGAVVFSTSGCGSSGSTTDQFPGSDEAGTSFDATVPVLTTDSGSSGDGSGPSCTPRTCAAAGANCGQVADGCGNAMDCGTCGAGQSCGGGGTANVCGGPTCVPKTCADPSVANLCGQQSDGCGGLIAAPCVTCTGVETCGGGGTPNTCGGTAGCIPATAATACAPDGGIPMNCGSEPDGCGGLVTCGTGAACPTGESCGGAGVPNVCGSSTVVPLPDGGTKTVDAGPPSCTPIPQATACSSGGVALCGPVSNGCGGTWTCPACTGSNSCGGGGTPSVCGHPACTPTPITTACTSSGGAALCGNVSNGCGGTYTCPTTCTGADTCGGNPSAPGVCGHPPCTPATTCPSGVNCGPWPDGCGGLIASCGTCKSPDICGGGGVSSQCGDSTPNVVCDAGLKCDLNECEGGTKTTLSGQIFDPAGKDPLYNVVVYVPNTTPLALTHGQFADGGLDGGSEQCPTCESLYTGDPIVSTTTDTDGKFTLTGVPVPLTGAAKGDVPIVIQVGRWRRQLIWPNVAACGATSATPTSTIGKLLRLPGKETTTAPTAAGATLDELPQIAVSTGSADSMECLFKRIGFSASEYVCGWNGGTGHIHIFQGGGNQGGNTTNGCSASSPTSLWDTDNDMYRYDIAVLSCEGEETYKAVPSVLHDFAQVGGRAFASHFHYSWFTGAPMDGNGNPAYAAPSDWGNHLATWYPSSNDICSNGLSAGDCNNDSWVNGNIIEKTADGGTPMKTWLGNVNALDTVVNGGFGTAAAGELNIQSSRMNAAVSSANTASQAWIVPDSPSSYEYADISGGVTTPLPSNSTQYFSFDTPIGGTGNAANPYCGRVVYSDLHVGAASGDYSNGPTTPDNCSGGSLTPQEKALEYMLLDLASCVGSDTNLPSIPPSCSKLTACPASVKCGSYPDGCGGSLTCGTCATGSSCVSGACVACKPLTACPSGTVCGDWPDGCGGAISCGTCTDPTTTCIAGTCKSGCTPEACPPSITCGPTGNGCGGTIASCGTCSAGTTCGGGGVPGKCGAGDANACAPLTCAEQGVSCGPAGDGCGGLISSCGTCTPPASCGGGGKPGVCGAPSCTPATCASLGADCGQVADGCGGLTANCGNCTGNASCGGGGTANVCGVPPCTPESCAQQGLNCGEAGDGCGNLLNCGTCTPPSTCGGGGAANVCGSGSSPK